MNASNLFQPLKVGNISLKHRIVMAPLTRYRADDNHVPLPMVKTYYEQRASIPGTLIITEGTFISPQSSGLASVPGLWTQEQLAAWKIVTDAIHERGSFVFVQLWALGRFADRDILKNEFNLEVKSSSAIPLTKDSPVPQQLNEEEIQDYIKQYATAARAAVEVAGFDGVEIHAANGSLIDQFTQDVSNIRTDRWGGSIENRSRFAVEVAKAVAAAIGPDRTGIRFSPWSPFAGMRMENPVPQFTDVISKLRLLNLAYLHLIESRIAGPEDREGTESLDFALQAWGRDRTILIAGGFTPEKAANEADKYGGKVAVVFGRYFISNPDLPFRIKSGIELTKYDRNTFYKARSPDGYIDYPFSDQFKN